ncbi:MAG TPA: amylo-alpha-1,6-glucosidase [Xanthobacteraceae bacterium]|nr:amylo-alpha-1,6-glucosidase [Xanthobacteraceae bacterium]
MRNAKSELDARGSLQAPGQSNPSSSSRLPSPASAPCPIRFGRSICGDLGQAERREWWVANGLGGYAGGTIAGSLTRRYHGLLIAPVASPLGRRLIFAKADATVIDGVESWPLFTNRWKSGAISPGGHVRIRSFHLDYSVPVWTYEIRDRQIETRIWMEPGAHTTYVAWYLSPAAEPLNDRLSLRVTLLANDRNHHETTTVGRFEPGIEFDGESLRLTDARLFSLTIRATGGVVVPKRDWYRDFDLPAEAERGLDSTDSHLCVGELTMPLVPGQWCGIVASLEAEPSADVAAALGRRLDHDHAAVARANTSSLAMRQAPAWITRLALAADAFVFSRPLPDAPDGESVIAGYPWFGDWGRDTMISLPGLTLATGRSETARRILQTFAGFVSEGMLPNVFPEAAERPEYNTVDASLWFFEAWRAYVDATGDIAALRAAFPILSDMVEWHQKGTRYGIRVDPADGLLKTAAAGVQLTWMDAKVGDWVVTPRVGKPVEINALWYNALCIMGAFATRLAVPDSFSSQAEAARRSFARFVRADGVGLFDVIDGPHGDDANIRPNQIFAVSLPYSPLSSQDQARVVRVCRRHLLTAFGLRSLAPGSPAYHPHYSGTVAQRDGGYHQGPVWGWLLGPFSLATYRVTGDVAAARAVLEPMSDALQDQAVGTIGEIFDGEPPHHPRGAPAQAWSVACTLEAWRRLAQAEQTAVRAYQTAERPDGR